MPRTVRVTDVSGSSFRVRVQNPSSAVCPTTVVYYLVAEESVWDSPVKLETRQYVTDTVGQNNNWDLDTRTFGQDYSGNILVFHQVMSYNAPSCITTYVSRKNSRTNPPRSGDDDFRIALNGAEAVDSHDAETISYIIIKEDYSELSAIKYDVKQTSDSVRGFGNFPPYNTAFSQSFDGASSVFVLTKLEMDGGDGVWIVNYSTSQTQAGLIVDEDQKKDATGVMHTKPVVS